MYFQCNQRKTNLPFTPKIYFCMYTYICLCIYMYKYIHSHIYVYILQDEGFFMWHLRLTVSWEKSNQLQLSQSVQCEHTEWAIWDTCTWSFSCTTSHSSNDSKMEYVKVGKTSCRGKKKKQLAEKLREEKKKKKPEKKSPHYHFKFLELSQLPLGWFRKFFVLEQEYGSLLVS